MQHYIFHIERLSLKCVLTCVFLDQKSGKILLHRFYNENVSLQCVLSCEF